MSEEGKWEESFKEWYRKEHELPLNEPLKFTDAYLYQRSGYLQACRDRQEEIERLKQRIKFLKHEAGFDDKETPSEDSLSNPLLMRVEQVFDEEAHT